MRYLIDVDGTLCETRGMDYATAKPIWPAIEEVRRLHRAGHEIVIKTCRGWGSGDDWHERTRQQLHRWGLIEGDGYDRLDAGVEFFDRIIDDRAENAADWHLECVA